MQVKIVSIYFSVAYNKLQWVPIIAKNILLLFVAMTIEVYHAEMGYLHKTNESQE